METVGDEIIAKIRAKFIEIFPPESVLAQALEDEETMKKFADFCAYVYGLSLMSQPSRPSHVDPYERLKWEKPWESYPTARPVTWTDTITSPGPGHHPPCTTADAFTQQFWSSLSNHLSREDSD